MVTLGAVELGVMGVERGIRQMHFALEGCAGHVGARLPVVDGHHMLMLVTPRTLRVGSGQLDDQDQQEEPKFH